LTIGTITGEAGAEAPDMKTAAVPLAPKGTDTDIVTLLSWSRYNVLGDMDIVGVGGYTTGR
jgi:hypothetical protein